jgi:hypothetical protein
MYPLCELASGSVKVIQLDADRGHAFSLETRKLGDHAISNRLFLFRFEPFDCWSDASGYAHLGITVKAVEPRFRFLLVLQ